VCRSNAAGAVSFSAILCRSPASANTDASTTLPLPARVGHVARVEMVYLLDDPPHCVYGKAVCHSRALGTLIATVRFKRVVRAL
jgi:hypothetical protein